MDALNQCKYTIVADLMRMLKMIVATAGSKSNNRVGGIDMALEGKRPISILYTVVLS